MGPLGWRGRRLDGQAWSGPWWSLAAGRVGRGGAGRGGAGSLPGRAEAGLWSAVPCSESLFPPMQTPRTPMEAWAAGSHRAPCPPQGAWTW